LRHRPCCEQSGHDKPHGEDKRWRDSDQKFERNALARKSAGIILSKPVARDDVKTIEDVGIQRLVVRFPWTIALDPQLIAFSKNFGELDPAGRTPTASLFNGNIRKLNVISKSSSTASRSAISATAEAVWHADMKPMFDVPEGPQLRLHSLGNTHPPGGKHAFATCFAAY